MAERPNILFFHVDNLGFGELSYYSSGRQKRGSERSVNVRSVRRRLPESSRPLRHRPPRS